MKMARVELKLINRGLTLRSVFLVSFLSLLLSLPLIAQSISEVNLRNVLQRELSAHPGRSIGIPENKYSGWYVSIEVKENQIKSIDFSENTFEIVIQKNEELTPEKLMELCAEKGVKSFENGIHIFPVLSEFISRKGRELDDNLEVELEKIHPSNTGSEDGSYTIWLPTLFKLYPPSHSEW
ncbi:hypothetical protein [Algoriphagus yeomjeoni]|uniref:Uncharacterized protein n=1 Tax=Algoriphagus yeomjeoni TaxID=291403 RepID=A0A327PR85_9BACT|nr:hypothetical protein [Algoriphagus yeomjeoni]RAI94800.1 hypothetical protein LV83_00047 [Algoriphagus yeomjeoni]